MSKIAVKRLTATAILTAISVILASSPCTVYLTPAVRISFRDLPVLIASLWISPWAGAVGSVAADLLGTVTSGAGWYPPLTVSALLIGLLPGVFRRWWFRSESVLGLWKTAACILFANLLAPVLWSTLCLARLYNVDFWLMFLVRLPQYLGMTALEAVVVERICRALEKTRLGRELAS